MGMKYQFHQTSENELKIYIEKGVYELLQKDLDAMKESVYQLVSRSMKITIKFTDTFIQNTVKFKPVLREKF